MNTGGICEFYAILNQTAYDSECCVPLPNYTQIVTKASRNPHKHILGTNGNGSTSHL